MNHVLGARTTKNFVRPAFFRRHPRSRDLGAVMGLPAIDDAPARRGERGSVARAQRLGVTARCCVRMQRPSERGARARGAVDAVVEAAARPDLQLITGSFQWERPAGPGATMASINGRHVRGHIVVNDCERLGRLISSSLSTADMVSSSFESRVVGWAQPTFIAAAKQAGAGRRRARSSRSGTRPCRARRRW